MGELFAFISALGYTSNAVLTRRGLQEKKSGDIYQVQFTVLLTTLIVFIIGISLSTLFGRNIIQEFHFLNITTVLLLILEGVLGPLTGLLLSTSAISQIGASRTSALRGCNPIFVTVLAIFLLGEKLTLTQIFAVIILSFGIILVSYRSQKESVSLLPRTKIAGSIIALLSGLSYAFAQIIRDVALQKGATPNTAMIIGVATALISITIIYRSKKGDFNIISHINSKSIYFYMGAGVASLVGRYSLLVAFTIIPVWLAVAIRNLQPVLAIILTWLFLRKVETINLRLIIGAVLIVFGLWVMKIH